MIWLPGSEQPRSGGEGRHRVQLLQGPGDAALPSPPTLTRSVCGALAACCWAGRCTWCWRCGIRARRGRVGGPTPLSSSSPSSSRCGRLPRHTLAHPGAHARTPHMLAAHACGWVGECCCCCCCCLVIRCPRRGCCCKARSETAPRKVAGLLPLLVLVSPSQLTALYSPFVSRAAPCPLFFGAAQGRSLQSALTVTNPRLVEWSGGFQVCHATCLERAQGTVIHSLSLYVSLV